MDDKSFYTTKSEILETLVRNIYHAQQNIRDLKRVESLSPAPNGKFISKVQSHEEKLERIFEQLDAELDAVNEIVVKIIDL